MDYAVSEGRVEIVMLLLAEDNVELHARQEFGILR
jgi:hypothetical protein